jgi:hypothetical protein
VHLFLIVLAHLTTFALSFAAFTVGMAAVGVAIKITGLVLTAGTSAAVTSAGAAAIQAAGLVLLKKVVTKLLISLKALYITVSLLIKFYIHN